LHNYLIAKCSQPGSFQERANSELSHFISAQKIDQRFGAADLVCSSCRNRCLNCCASSSSQNSSLSGLSSWSFSIASSTPWPKNLETSCAQKLDILSQKVWARSNRLLERCLRKLVMPGWWPFLRSRRSTLSPVLLPQWLFLSFGKTTRLVFTIAETSRDKWQCATWLTKPNGR
jgi:hypothetical protein